MSNWTMEEVDALREENGGGNAVARRVWFARWDEAQMRKPTDKDHVDYFKKFINRVYNDQAFYDEDGNARSAAPSASSSSSATRRSSQRAAQPAAAAGAFACSVFLDKSGKVNPLHVNVVQSTCSTLARRRPRHSQPLTPSRAPRPVRRTSGGSSPRLLLLLLLLQVVEPSSRTLTALQHLLRQRLTTDSEPLRRLQRLLRMMVSELSHLLQCSSSRATTCLVHLLRHQPQHQLRRHQHLRSTHSRRLETHRSLPLPRLLRRLELLTRSRPRHRRPHPRQAGRWVNNNNKRRQLQPDQLTLAPSTRSRGHLSNKCTAATWLWAALGCTTAVYTTVACTTWG